MLQKGGDALGIDSRSLERLRSEAARDPKAASHQAAVQFESLFMQMVLKSMRDATPKAEGADPGMDSFTGMFDTQLAKQFAGRPHGLADVIEQQLTRHMQNLPAVSPANAAPPQQVPATAAGTAPSAGAPASSRAAAFIQQMLPHAKEAERQTGVPASYIVGQAALESGWGRAEARNADGTQSFNLFGIKATPGWKGASAESPTTEYEGGQAVRKTEAFRSYGSYAEAFTDYARMLASNPRYQQARVAQSAEAFAGRMQQAGYATDPQYAAKLARTINHTLALQRAQG